MAQASSLMPGMKNLDPDAKKVAEATVKPSAKVLGRLLKYTGKQKKTLILVIFLAAVSCTLDVFAPYYLGEAIDKMRGVGQVDLQGILSIVLLLLGFYLCSSLFLWLVNYCAGILAAGVGAQLRKDGFAKISRMPLHFFDTRSHGDILSRFINDTDAVTDGLLQGVVQLLTAGITLIGTFIFMTMISWKMLIIVLPSAVLTFFLASLIMRLTSKYFKRQQKALGELSGLVEEIFSGLREVKAFGREKKTQKTFEAINQELYDAGQKAQFASSMPNPTTRFVNYLAYVLICVFGWSVGGLSIGQLTSFITYWNLFSKPLNDFTNISAQIVAAFAAAGRIFEMIDLPEESEEGAMDEDISPSDIKGAVEFSHVHFSYLPQTPLIRDFSLSVKPGQRVAIVGPTGAGKTTIINLLMRFYEPDSGEILLDGKNILNIKRECLRKSFGMVLQDTWLFKGSIRDNLLYGKEDATEEEMVAACKAVHAHSFISRLEKGYDTVVSESGGNFSAGQKQLLTIARAMIAKPAMLILDEATSSVDTLTELRIQEAFSLLMKGKTSFIIAHRLSTIREADMILVLKDGQVIEKGTHEALLSEKGFYSTLYYSQFDTLGEERE